MAWRSLLSSVQLMLLLLLLTGSSTHPTTTEVQRAAGETFSVRCQYPPTRGAYEKKSWCREKSVFRCNRLVTSSGPHMRTWTSRFSIWDDPSAGFFIVTMESLRKEDSGYYQCTVDASERSISKSSRFYLQISPAPTSWPEATFPQPPPRPLNPTSASSQTTWAPSPGAEPKSPGQTEGARTDSEVLIAKATWAVLQNSTLVSDPAAPCALVPVLCGVTVFKSLLLLVLVSRALRNWHRPCGRSPGASPTGALLSHRTQVGRLAYLPQAWAPGNSSLTSELRVSFKEKPGPHRSSQTRDPPSRPTTAHTQYALGPAPSYYENKANVKSVPP